MKTLEEIVSKLKVKMRKSDAETSIVSIPPDKSEKILCSCSECNTQSIGFFECLPMKDGHWTSCEVSKCLTCGKIHGFPKDNLKDAIENGTDETLKALKDVGVPVEKILNERIKNKELVNPSRRDS